MLNVTFASPVAATIAAPSGARWNVRLDTMNSTLVPAYGAPASTSPVADGKALTRTMANLVRHALDTGALPHVAFGSRDPRMVRIMRRVTGSLIGLTTSEVVSGPYSIFTVRKAHKEAPVA